jgi:hypothetical protein
VAVAAWADSDWTFLNACSTLSSASKFLFTLYFPSSPVYRTGSVTSVKTRSSASVHHVSAASMSPGET